MARIYRVFDFALQQYPNCRGELTISAVILEQRVIEKTAAATSGLPLHNRAP